LGVSRPKGSAIRALALLALIGLPLLASVLSAAYVVHLYAERAAPSVRSFASYAQLLAYVRDQASGPARGAWLPSLPGAAFTAPAITAPAPPAFSRTNIQVEGVDEADIVKADGRFIYIAKEHRVLLLNAYPPEQMQVVASLELGELVARELYVSGDRLAVLAEVPIFCITFPCPQQLALLIYDIADRGAPGLLFRLSSNGTLVTSRLIGGSLYLLAMQPSFRYGERGPEPQIPSYVLQGELQRLAPSDIYYNEDLSRGAPYYLLIFRISLNNATAAAKALLMGYAATVYVSAKNLYVAFALPEFAPFIAAPGAAPFRPAALGNTSIVRIALEPHELRIAAQGTVPGLLLDQFSLDEKGEQLRVATHLWRLTQKGAREESALYVLDPQLKVVGALEGISPGEAIYAVRFVGDVAFMVTFKKVDPLIAISLAEPSRPRVLGELKLPGFSEYLHPLPGGYLMGVGKDAVEDRQGDFAWYQGLKVSLFRLRVNGALQEIESFILGYRGSDSPLLQDHRALAQYALPNGTLLLAFPALIAGKPNSTEPWAYGQPIWQGVLLFAFEEQGALELRANLTHIPEGADVNAQQALHVLRALFIGEFVYTLSGELLAANSLVDMRSVGSLSLPP
jgi:uncharacterized secreted protein with C-terminal beta-propeller domain